MKKETGRNKGSHHDPAAERLIDELKRRISEIETDEIIEGETEEELEARGFLGDNDISISRSDYMNRRLSAGYSFPEGIHFITHHPVNSSDDIIREGLDEATIITPETTAVTRPVTGKKDVHGPEDIFDKQYMYECNLDISISEGTLRFRAKQNGRLVLAGEKLYLVPSDNNGSFTVRIVDNGMRALADFTPPEGNGTMPDCGAICSKLEELGVRTGIRTDVIKDILKKVITTSEPARDVIVAEGKPAVDGADAEIELKFDSGPMQEEYRVLPDGRIDYRKQAAIPIVHKGDLLAVVSEPSPGSDGFDLSGAVVTAYQGERKVLCAGINVSENDAREYRAECDGQVSLNGNVLSVYKQYVVEGNVDYGCGNVRFNGNVTVKGNVLPGFEVNADGDIVVRGNTDGATLQAGRDIRVESGIIGRKDHAIRCGRDIITKHIQNGVIEAQGDVIVKNSIVQSTVNAGGKILLSGKKAAIIGGTACALDSIHTRNIGSEYGVRTFIEAGNDYLAKKAGEEIDKSTQFCSNNIKKIDDVFLSLKAMIEKGVELSQDKKNTISHIQKKRSYLIKYRETMKWKKKKLQEQSHRNPTAAICIENTLFADVILKILDKKMTIHTATAHVCFRYNAEKDRIVQSAYSKK
ncbi:MAG: DUF342 domain-containing protein [Chitinivibrionales bacterium]|nr:DUF342 domain-containing protein [Chitinivibrionales bacterium]